jgi:hypothetical protein
MAGFSFVFLSDELCDPLWFNVLYFTTKVLKGLHKGHKGLFQQPQRGGEFNQTSFIFTGSQLSIFFWK